MKKESTARKQEQPRRERLAEVARTVRKDAKKRAPTYLKDSEVPFGGE